MMNVEVRLVRGRKKYYLAHSYRRAGRPEKVRVFLGYDLSRGELRKRLTTARVRLKNRADALKQIRDPYTDGLDSYETAELRGLASDSKVRMIHLSEEGWQRFTEAFAYNTNAIEGSTVTGDEVKAVLAGGLWPERPKEEIAETLSVAEAVKFRSQRLAQRFSKACYGRTQRRTPLARGSPNIGCVPRLPAVASRF